MMIIQTREKSLLTQFHGIGHTKFVYKPPGGLGITQESRDFSGMQLSY